MKEILPLPDISIKIDLKTKIFLKAIEAISKRSNNCSETKSDMEEISGKGFFIVAVKPIEQRGNNDLIAQLISYGENTERIQVEIRGFKKTPSYQEYVDCAQEIVNPLIKQYNKENQKKYRVTIHKKAIKLYTLPPGAQKYFNKFTIFPDSSHPSDKHNFHFFIRYCHQYKVKLTGYQLKELLLKKGFSESNAQRYREIYTCGREILCFDY
jgi:hypothetical protein